jgi:hypothetical protein
MANLGDSFLPLAGWTTVAMSQVRVGIELNWANSAEDLLANRMQRIQLHLSAEQARELAASLVAQAAMAEQRSKPN